MKKIFIIIAVIGLITSIAFAAENNNLAVSNTTVVPAVTTAKNGPATKAEKKVKKSETKKVIKQKRVKKTAK